MWLSAARGLSGSGARRSRYGAGARARHRRQSSLVWTRPGVVTARFRAVWRGVCGATSARAAAGPSTRRRYAAVGLAPQGTLAVVRGVAGEGGDGRRAAIGVPLASPVSGGGAERFGGSWKRTRPTPGEPEGVWARRRSAASRASMPVLPERDDGQRGAGRCGGARGCPRSGGREGRPAGLRRRRELPTSLNRSMGERVRGDLHVQTVNSRHSRLKDFLRAAASPPAIGRTIGPASPR